MSDSGIDQRAVLPKLPTYARYRYFADKIHRISLTRALQYEVLESYLLNGEVLDFGGGEKAHYRKLLNCSSCFVCCGGLFGEVCDSVLC